MQKVGPRIAELRKGRGWSQKYLADMMGIKQPAVVRWEKDLTSPTDENISKLSKIFEVERSHFIDIPSLSDKDLHELFDKLKSLPFSQQLACASVIREFYAQPSASRAVASSS